MAFSEFEGATGLILLQDGIVIPGRGNGAEGHVVGEFCFNTALTGYQEILTDPSYAGQIITFTMPHIGNVGGNIVDCESAIVRAGGCITACSLPEASNYRSEVNLACWLEKHKLVCVSEIDSRALTRHIRRVGALGGVIAHSGDGLFDMDILEKDLASWEGIEKRDLASIVSCRETYEWSEGLYDLKAGAHHPTPATKYHIVAFDYGLKTNMLRHLAMRGARVTVVPLDEPPEKIFALKPDGFFLTNGPGDPSATNKKTGAVLRQIVDYGKPVFGICLGHQLLALAFGARTKKMHFGHHGANHPVKNLEKGRVEITSQNHGFTVDGETLPAIFEVTHKSLFDDTVEGLRLKDRPVFSVQYHPESSPGPHDSHYLFDDFIRLVDDMKASP